MLILIFLIFIKDLNQDVIAMAAKMSEGVERGLIIRNENANENYNTEFMFRLFSEEGKGLFSCRRNILGMHFLFVTFLSEFVIPFETLNISLLFLYFRSHATRRLANAF